MGGQGHFAEGWFLGATNLELKIFFRGIGKNFEKFYGTLF